MQFEEIHKNHSKPLYWYVKRMVKNNEDAEDITSEVMVKIYKNLNSFDESKSKITTWIYSIARNMAIDFLRKKRGVVVSLEIEEDNETRVQDFLFLLKDNTANPEYELIYNELEKRVQERFDTLLSKKDKQIAELHFKEGLSYKEIADELGVPLGSVKAKIHIAKNVIIGSLPKGEK